MNRTDNPVCTLSERLKFYDCDYKNRIKISTILKIAAEIAGYDYTVKGYGHEFLWKNQMVFLMSRMSLRILKYPAEYEVLKMSTWECGKKGAIFLRGTDIADESGEIIIEALSGWVLANPETRHIYKPSAFRFEMPQLPEKTVDTLDIGKIPHENVIYVMNRDVRITDLDSNGHVYNAIYADIACDAMAKADYEKDVYDFRINFVSEAKLGDRIDIFSGESEKAVVIIGKVGEKVCFETEYTFKN